MKFSIRDYYKIIKIEDPKIKDVPYAKMALFEENSYLGSILDAFDEKKIIRFIEQFSMMNVNTGDVSFLSIAEFKHRSFSDNYKAMIVLTGEEGFKKWQKFMTEKFKAHERGFAVGFCRRQK